MSVRDDLLDSINQLLSSATSLGYDEPAATNDVYENYIWTMCVEAAQRHGATVSYETVHGAPASTLVFRTSPGSIWSTAHNYTHAILDISGCAPLEVHVGIRVLGKSRVLHECDVAVLYREEADLCRTEQVHPRASKVIIAAECKFYTSAIQLHLGRGFLGLTSDIHRKERYFVTNSHSDSVTKLIAHHQSEWECGVVPNSQPAEDLFHSFSRAFRNFRASA